MRPWPSGTWAAGQRLQLGPVSRLRCGQDQGWQQLLSLYSSQVNLVDSVRHFRVASPVEREAILLRNVFLGSLFLTAFFALMASPMALVMAADHNLTLREAIAWVLAWIHR